MSKRLRSPITIFSYGSNYVDCSLRSATYCCGCSQWQLSQHFAFHIRIRSCRNRMQKYYARHVALKKYNPYNKKLILVTPLFIYCCNFCYCSGQKFFFDCNLDYRMVKSPGRSIVFHSVEYANNKTVKLYNGQILPHLKRI